MGCDPELELISSMRAAEANSKLMLRRRRIVEEGAAGC
jgi:hypothetical protein